MAGAIGAARPRFAPVLSEKNHCRPASMRLEREGVEGAHERVMRLLLLGGGPATFKARRGTGKVMRKSRAAKAAWRKGSSAKVCIAM